MFQNLINSIVAMYTRLVCGDLQLIRVETRRRSRAATFIEYALLAGVGVSLVVLFRGRLRGIVEGLLENVGACIGGVGECTIK